MLHQVIETLNSRVALRPRYDNFIGGKWVAPVDDRYFDNISPITGRWCARSHARKQPTSSLRSTPRTRLRTPRARRQIAQRLLRRRDGGG